MTPANPPENQWPDTAAPHVPEGAPETVPTPPEAGGVAPGETSQPPQPAPEMPPPIAGAPLPVQKLTTNVPFFLLGLFTPIVIMVGVTFLSSWLNNALSGIIFMAVPVALLFASAALFLAGGRKGSSKLKSFGKGALWSFAAIPLLGLLLFGSCLIGGLPV